MQLYRLLVVLLAFSVVTVPLDAQRRGSRSSSGKVHVRGYTRRDGTSVAPYTRAAPRSRSYAAPSRPSQRGYASPSPRPRSYSKPSQPRSYKPPTARRTPSARPYRPPATRSRSARNEFLRRSGYPRGRPGYVVDHVVPLCAGGADAPRNMQWQTVEQAKVKDRQERASCAARRR